VSHWKVSLAYGAAQVIIGFSLILIKPEGVPFLVLAYSLYSLIFALASLFIRKKVSAR
jgi:hypothetical protein